MTDPTPDPARYSLVMPFIACQSKGGPYDDQSFSAGYHAGLLDKSLEVAAIADATGIDVTVRTLLVPQLDLLAMRWGFRIDALHDCAAAPGWSSLTFTRRPEEDDEP